MRIGVQEKCSDKNGASQSLGFNNRVHTDNGSERKTPRQRVQKDCKMKITVTTWDEYAITGTPLEIAEAIKAGDVNREEVKHATRFTESAPPPIPHNDPYQREHRCYLQAAIAQVRGQKDVVTLWYDRLNRINHENRPSGQANPLYFGDSLNELAREGKCSEEEIRAYWEQRLDFKFGEHAAKIVRVEVGYASAPPYVLFDNGACYTHANNVSGHPATCSAGWGGSEGLQVSGVKRWVVQPRKHDWIEGFLKAAYAVNENPLPILRAITGWEWKMERSSFSSDGTSCILYSMPDEAIRQGCEWPAISGSNLGCHNSGSGFYRVETEEAKRLQAINYKFRNLPMEGAAEEIADWLDGFSWRSPYKSRTVARFLREHWGGRTIRVEVAHFSAGARQGTITAEGWKFVEPKSGERIACFSSDGFFNNLGLKTPESLTATPVAAVLFGQGPVGCE